MGTSFLSTPSARRATPHRTAYLVRRSISIHALREEGDPQADRPVQGPRHFYPRPPRGGRPFSFFVLLFLCNISIHALREEGDCLRFQGPGGALYFYPRPPRGGRQLRSCRTHITPITFLSTPSARRATFLTMFLMSHSSISIHALREEGDL